MDAASYLAGIVDGEGTISVRPGRVRIGNTDEDIIRATRKALDDLGIYFREGLYKRGRHKPCWEIVVSRHAELRRFRDLVPIQAETKRQRLDAAIEGYAYRQRPSPDELRDLYERDGRSIAQVGAALGTSTATAHAWLRAAGVVLRSRSEAATNRWRRAA